MYALPLFTISLRLSWNGCPGELTHQHIKLLRLLILELLAALIQLAGIDTSIYTLESLAGLGWTCQEILAPPDSHNRHLQARKRLVRIHNQAIAERRGCRVTAIRLVGAAVDIFHQFIGNQPGIVVALAIIVALNRQGYHNPGLITDELVEYI